jgi:hypothetical protein
MLTGNKKSLSRRDMRAQRLQFLLVTRRDILVTFTTPERHLRLGWHLLRPVRTYLVSKNMASSLIRRETVILYLRFIWMMLTF